MHDGISNAFRESSRLLAQMADTPDLLRAIETVSGACVRALGAGHKLLFMGNGGSAADAQHLASEIVNRFAYDRPGLPAFALSVDSSVLTSIGNDYGYDQVFARQVEAVGRPGDVLFGISTSGDSPNILRALEIARPLGVVTVGMTGNRRGRITAAVDYCIEVPANATPRIQEGHIVIGHILCSLIEQAMFPRA